MAGTEDLTRAVELAGAGDWEAAHRIVQAHEDRTAYWLHALLHKIEGDEANSRYWYARGAAPTRSTPSRPPSWRQSATPSPPDRPLPAPHLSKR
jgi:hypothetical protein